MISGIISVCSKLVQVTDRHAFAGVSVVALLYVGAVDELSVGLVCK